jgi:hypothetical protein
MFGYAVHHLVRARFCIERERLWQAQYWLSGARDLMLSRACLRLGLATRSCFLRVRMDWKGLCAKPGIVRRELPSIWNGCRSYSAPEFSFAPLLHFPRKTLNKGQSERSEEPVFRQIAAKAGPLSLHSSG